MCEMSETMNDYIARLNIEGERNVWKDNRGKIDYVLGKTRNYVKRSSSACDVGIGDGYLLTQLNAAGLKTTGIEISGYLVRYFRDDFRKKGLDIRLIQGDITNINLEAVQFDMVTCFDILEHIPGDNLRLAFETLKNCLVNGGLLIGTLPLGENLEDNMVMCPKCGHRFHRVGHFHSFQTTEEINKVLQPEFTIVKIGKVPFSYFKSNMVNFVCTRLLKLAKSIFHRKIITTAYFVAKSNKS